jgi:putative copper export protein
MTVDLLIILNNFFHDLASAMWFCGTLTLLALLRAGNKNGHPEVVDFSCRLFRRVSKITNISLAIVVLGGVVRAINYQKYEWLPALGRDQVVLLVVKHILLTGIVFGGIYIQVRMARQFRQARGSERPSAS